MKVWIEKTAVITATRSLGVRGWAQGFNVWIPGALQDDAIFNIGETVEIGFRQGPFGRMRLRVPSIAVRFEHRLLTRSIPLRWLSTIQEIAKEN